MAPLSLCIDQHERHFKCSQNLLHTSRPDQLGSLHTWPARSICEALCSTVSCIAFHRRGMPSDQIDLAQGRCMSYFDVPAFQGLARPALKKDSTETLEHLERTLERNGVMECIHNIVHNMQDLVSGHQTCKGRAPGWQLVDWRLTSSTPRWGCSPYISPLQCTWEMIYSYNSLNVWDQV